MEVVIDFEYLRGRQNEIIVKEEAVAGENVSDSFRFESPYHMAPHGSTKNGLNWDDGNRAHHKLVTILKEAVVEFAHLYSFGITKCRFLSELLEYPILNLEGFGCPQPKSFKSKFSCSLPSHKFHAHALYDWLMYHLRAKSYVRCPPDMTRHTSKFISTI